MIAPIFRRMAEIIRSWQCQNSRCGKRFDAWEANPECPKCHCVRVSWVPGGGHVAGTAKAADAELRNLAECFRMENMHSAERGRGAKIVAPQAPIAAGPARQFAPGFTAAAPMDRAVCVPSSTPIDFKAKVGIGNKLSPNASFPAMRTNTAIEAAHKP